MIYTKKIGMAIKFAAKTHNQYQNQTRKGKVIPYISHPLTAGIILALAGASEDVVVAGILHDTIEDSVPEKKVTAEMLSERFGDRVAGLVLSVTETDKTLSWDDRKRQALEHVAHFSNDSLLVKSADILSNVSETVNDYRNHGDEVFAHFSVPKEKMIGHQLSVIAAILERWKENPLTEDLLSIEGELRAIRAE
ncbi:MAG: HD domain-containing protein [Candidatus Moranbacteria bacterium]|nr:HD domain-containing protein [Candidatus Moranbacteria bacterium]